MQPLKDETYLPPFVHECSISRVSPHLGLDSSLCKNQLFIQVEETSQHWCKHPNTNMIYLKLDIGLLLGYYSSSLSHRSLTDPYHEEVRSHFVIPGQKVNSPRCSERSSSLATNRRWLTLDWASWRMYVTGFGMITRLNILLKSVLKEYMPMFLDILFMTTTTITQNSGLLRRLAGLPIPDVSKERTSFTFPGRVPEPTTLKLSVTNQKPRIPNSNNVETSNLANTTHMPSGNSRF